MPGGGAGGGQILSGVVNGLVRGMGGGGMGGSGMGGVDPMMNGQGSMFQNSNNQNTQQGTQLVGEYDIDRWKRADGIDEAVTTPTIQEVKDDWAKRNKKKQKEIKSHEKEDNKRYLNQTREQDAAELREEKARIEDEERGTRFSSDIKKASRRINNGKNENVMAHDHYEEAAAHSEKTEMQVKKNYLGLYTESSIEDFFSSNPENSLLLAVDQLSLSPLTMSQVKTDKNFSRKEFEPKDNMNLEKRGTEYMDAFHESREERKYQVRFIK